jgi:AcrR family transcriptional regulator
MSEPREEILDAAACLFVERGFAATPPRAVAEAAGIREAQIRHHFPAGKEEILAELLERTIRPRLDNAEKVEDLRAATGAGPDVLLYVLARLDARSLARAPHNSGALARQVEVQHQDVGAPFRAAHEELLAAYTRFGSKVGSAPALSGDLLGTMLLHQVEGVVEMRLHDGAITPDDEASVAASCLLLSGVGPARTREVAEQAAELIRRIA